VLTPYLSLLRRPGTFRFSSAGFIQRLPLSMLGLGVVLFLTLRGEPYAVAGTIAAVGAVTNACVGPFVSRYIDRLTQHRVLPVVVVIALAFQITFLVLVLSGAPVWTWFVSFALGEAFVPNVGSLIRARWAFVLSDADDVRTAFAFESVVDEFVFLIGPILATVLAVSWIAWGAIGASIALLAIGTLLLVPQRATEPEPAGVGHHEGKAAIRYTGVPLVFAVFFLAGGLFGASEVSTIAFAAERDIRVWTGVLLACYATGSALAGLIVGTRHSSRSLSHQFRIAVIAMGFIALPFPFVTSPVLLGALSFLAGLAVAPSMITGMALTERLVPASRLTEGLTIVISGLTVGFAAGTSLAGPLIDAHGSRAGFAVCAAFSLLGAALVAVGTAHLDRALRGVTLSGHPSTAGDGRV